MHRPDNAVTDALERDAPNRNAVALTIRRGQWLLAREKQNDERKPRQHHDGENHRRQKIKTEHHSVSSTPKRPAYPNSRCSTHHLSCILNPRPYLLQPPFT